MRCPKCNADVPEQAKFCRFCGSPVSNVQMPENGMAQPSGYGTQQPPSNGTQQPFQYGMQQPDSGRIPPDYGTFPQPGNPMPAGQGPKKGKMAVKVAAWILFAAVLAGSDFLLYDKVIQKSAESGSEARLQGNVAEEMENISTEEEVTEENPMEGSEEVKEEKLYSVTPSETTISLKYGEHYQLYVKTDAPDEDPFTFTSNNEHITVDENGLIFAGEAGATATVTVGLESGKTQPVECTVNVMSKEETFYANVEKMDNGAVSTPLLSIYEEKAKVPEKDYSLMWDESLFYSLEDVDLSSDKDGLIDGYRIEKRLFVNEDTGNQVEYEVYCAPDTGIINKIVSIESYADYVEITDYYYDDHGKINFIFQRKDSVYTPTYATKAKKGKRFYFNNDVMVKYRNITSPFNVTDMVLEKMEVDEIRYDSAKKKDQKEYDRLWEKMLNAAYNTYQMVISTPSVGYLSGYVFDQYNNPLSNADIAITAKDYNYELYHTQTDANGYYHVMVPTYEGTYRLDITSANCVDTQVSEIAVDETVLDHYVENVYMIQNDNQYHDVEVMVYDVLNKQRDGMRPLGNITLNIRSGMNNITGDIYQTCYTDSDGHAIISLPSGAYTVQIMQSGYEDSYFNIFSGHDTFVQNGTSPILNEDEVRIVLTWGEYPNDLDSHLFTPYQGYNGDMQHIGYYDREDDYGNNLDVDDTTSYGPETMTIKNLKSGTYKYFVADFTNCSRGNYSSYDMSYSGATVRIYNSSGLAGIFFVPYNRSGVIWEVFEIRNGRIIPVQRYYNNIEDKEWWRMGKENYSIDEIDY